MRDSGKAHEVNDSKCDTLSSESYRTVYQYFYLVCTCMWEAGVYKVSVIWKIVLSSKANVL